MFEFIVINDSIESQADTAINYCKKNLCMSNKNDVKYIFLYKNRNTFDYIRQFGIKCIKYDNYTPESITETVKDYGYGDEKCRDYLKFTLCSSDKLSEFSLGMKEMGKVQVM